MIVLGVGAVNIPVSLHKLQNINSAGGQPQVMMAADIIV